MKTQKKTRIENLEAKGFRVSTTSSGVIVENREPRKNRVYPGLAKQYSSITAAHKELIGW